jgi:uncharacterized protein YggU (UPF0235/DUF167 family)
VIAPVSDGIRLAVRVIPRAGRTGIAGVRDGALLVRLAAAPVDGAANDALAAVIADALGVPKSRVTMLTGARGRSKVLHVAGIDAAAAAFRLRPFVNP